MTTRTFQAREPDALVTRVSIYLRDAPGHVLLASLLLGYDVTKEGE